MFGMQGRNFSSWCTLCPTGATDDPSQYKEFSLVFFSTFEPISLTPDSCMQRKGVTMLYERSATVLPSLYVCHVQNVLGRVPLIPCYLNGNTSNTIPYRYRGAIPTEPAADSRSDSGTGFESLEADSSRSTFGCGATAKDFHGRSLRLTLWHNRRCDFRNPGDGRLPPWSALTLGLISPEAKRNVLSHA